jgi:hypothetical protein
MNHWRFLAMSEQIAQEIYQRGLMKFFWGGAKINMKPGHD